MFYLLISILSGIVISLKLNLFIFIFLAITIFLIIFISNKKTLTTYIFYIIICTIFIIFTSLKINSYDFKYQDKTNVKGEFLILSIKENGEYYNKYICKNKSGDKFILQIKVKENILLNVKNKIYLEGTFNLPDLNRNTGGFNYRRYLNSQNIYGTITAKSNSIILLEKNKIDFISKIKNVIEETYKKLLPKDYAGIINGMLNGDTKNVSKEILNDFKNSGITHLLAVSGSNVAYIIIIISLCSNKIFGKYLSHYIIIISIIIFIFVSGASASVARAGIMAILNIGAIIFSRKSDTLNNIFFSAVILLIINPLIVYDVGFILSFFGTLGIVLLSKKIILKIEKVIKIKFISETSGVTFSAQIVLLPIMAYYFNTLSIISIITNLLVVPISGFLTILGFIAVIISNINFSLGKIVSYAIYTLISFMLKVASFFSKIPFANLIVPTPKIWMIIFYYLIIYLIATENKKEIVIKIFNYKRIRKLKIVLLEIIFVIIIINSIANIIPRNYIKLNMIDVGQGDSFYIETKNRKTILVDGGGSESSDYDIGENILVPYLLDKGKTKIDLVIISHPHEDHIEGIFTVIEKLKVKKVIIGENLDNNELIIKLKEICKNRKTKIIKVSAGDSFCIDDVYFDVIYPNIKIKEENINNMSLVLKMKYGEIVTLFTGDLEEEAENNINQNIKADILKVSHHGSNTSTSDKFLNKVLPKIALISVGKDNSYGHPSKEVLERLERKNINIYRTDLIGEVMLKIYKNKIELKNEW